MNQRENKTEEPTAGFGDEDGLWHLRDYMQVLWRRRWWIILCFGLVLVVTIFHTLRSRPVYEATALLEIQKSGGQTLSLESLFEEELGPGVEKELLTEIEILKSRTVAETTVRVTGSQARLDKSKRLYRTLLERIFASPRKAEDIFSRNSREPAEPLHAEALKVSEIDRALPLLAVFSKGGEFQVFTEEGHLLCKEKIGKPWAGNVVSFVLKGSAPPEGTRFGLTVLPLAGAVKSLQEGLEVTPVRNTRVIRLKFKSTDRHEAGRLLAGIISSYDRFKIERKTQVASNALDFINEQLKTIETQLQQAVNELKNYKEENKLVSLNENVQVVINRLAQTESSRKEVEILSSQAKLLLANLEGQGSVDQESLYTLGTTLDQPMLVSLASNMTTIQAERAALRSHYTQRHPKIQALDDQILELKRKIRAEISSLLASLEGKAGALGREIKGTEAELGTLPEAEQKLAELTRNAKVHQDTYAFMLQKRGEIQVTRAGLIGDAWVVEPAWANPSFVKPNVRSNLALGLILGLMLGLGLAFVVEYLDETIKNSDDVQKLVTIPVLASIGHYIGAENGNSDKRFVPLLDDPRSQHAEGFRTLRSNLLFTAVDRPCRLMLFSSALPGEGKSTCAANLAVGLSQAENKVLLVDADLRKPVQHKIFQCRRSPGLVNVLVAEDWQKALDDAIQPTVLNNLHLLVCGHQPPNPSEMLGSEKMGQVIEALREKYDFVLFDSSPVLALSDALVLSQRLDGIICVVRARYTGRNAMRNAMERYNQTHAPVIGIVLNDIDFHRERYYYSYHYKYYKSYYGSEKKKVEGQKPEDGVKSKGREKQSSKGIGS